ncbi:hypothetical protein AB4865_04465 [Capnocytophaga sp. ARDL2]|uniref:hypothetical protein n=1 Tax=Capnocytophaga sp. ARDL2 TaxID=3238809 RepID=UPI003556F6BA
MIQYYKHRNLSELFNDTFLFFRQNGKNFFKNYLLLNTPIFLLFGLMGYLVSDTFISPFMNGKLDGQQNFIEQMISNNFTWFVVAFVTMVLFFIFMGILNYLFPIFYLRRVVVHKENKVKMDTIFSDFKNNKWKIVKFFIGTTFFTVPVFILVAFGTFLSIFLIIGILLIFLVTPFIVNVFNFHMYDYFSTSRGFFSSFLYAVRAQFSYEEGSKSSPFWKYTGTTFVLHILINIISWVFMIFPLILSISVENILASDETYDEKTLFIYLILSLVFQILSFLVLLILNNVISIGCGFMYCDHRTDLHRKEDLLEIQNLGNDL